MIGDSKILTNDFGFRVDRQKGDHIMLIHDQTKRYATSQT
jgi:predicted RNA binding protein YcfA (HicA-like mRNA interferase family)